MKYLVLAFTVLLAACEPLERPADIADYSKRSNDLQYYDFKHKLIRLNDGREIECLIRDVYAGYAMDCNWNYKGKLDETRR